MSVVKVTAYADNIIAIGKDGKRVESHPSLVETLDDSDPEAQAILNPPKQPDPGPSIEDRLAILEAAAQLPDGIPTAYKAATEAAAVVAPVEDPPTKPLKVGP